MNAHIGVDAESGLVQAECGTAANVNDGVEANSLLYGQEPGAFGDAGYQGAANRADAKPDVEWHVAMRPGKRRALDKTDRVSRLLDGIERLKASVRAKVEHPVQGHQAAVRVREASLSRADEEHGAVGDAVRAVQLVDGQARIGSV